MFSVFSVVVEVDDEEVSVEAAVVVVVVVVVVVEVVVVVVVSEVVVVVVVSFEFPSETMNASRLSAPDSAGSICLPDLSEAYQAWRIADFCSFIFETSLAIVSSSVTAAASVEETSIICFGELMSMVIVSDFFVSQT